MLMLNCDSSGLSYYRHSSGSLSYNSSLPTQHRLPGPCTCPDGSTILKDHIPQDQYEELMQRRAKEFQTNSILSKLLFALPNSPLQYPIQGVIVRPLTATAIPGMSSSIYASVTNVLTKLTIESSTLLVLNDLLAKVSYTSTIYHINSGDLGMCQKCEENLMLLCGITSNPSFKTIISVYFCLLDISSQVTIVTKTFVRYKQLRVLLDSIRKFYSNIKVIIADDSLEPESVTGENIQHYIMPPAQGWFAGRNLAVSQVTTKYFLWVDDDFLFSEETKIEKLVEVMEAVPELDMVGGSVQGNQNRLHFSILYEEGDENEGGCLYRMSGGKFHSLPSYPQCHLASGVVNFFLARTDAMQRVRFDPKLQRVAHSEFFVDGLGSLMVASCGDVTIDHQPKIDKNSNPTYHKFRNPGRNDGEFRLQLHFFKNYLKCIRYG
uniref:Glycosyltransferase 2-like domain-containing protein n=1 Tax=Neolamprologus brichardi TaxID=32507 RepID=A0A3Q4GFZ7_NEOBR